MGATGALTFLFTDLEGSTRLWERAPDQMGAALARHDALVRESIGGHAGRVFATGGDGVAAVFERAEDAIDAACQVQALLGSEPWPDDVPIRVRIGLHSGHAEERDGDYFGSTLNRAARLMAIAHGGQILCSGATASLVEGATSAPLADLGLHRLRDLSQPVAVFQVGEGRFPPLRSLDSVPSNLPTTLTELVGRTEEIRSLVAEVRQHRLITLTGVGGVGKTRLALAVGGALAPEFVDGCWLVELAPLADGAEVARTILTSLGASSVADDGALRSYLEHRRLVLILDNCEHVLDAAAEATELILAAAPDVHVVTTSREPLGLHGEVVRRVRSLSLPSDLDPGHGTEAAAVQLFVERARAADGDFELSEANAGDVRDICEHLDGIPLALELAAARVASMAPAEIARRLDDRFRVLTGGRRAQERHRTLQATVGWSYDLLTRDEQALFGRLSVFPASFDLEAATAIAATDDVDEHDVVDAVLRLVQRSLVSHDHTTGRYRLLETLRQYGADRIAEAGQSDAVRERYAAHYLEVVASHGPGMKDHRHQESVETLSRDLDHIRATAEWLTREQRWTDLHRLAVDAIHFFAQFTPGEATQWLEHVVASGDVTGASDLVDTLGCLAFAAANSLQFDIATARANEAIRLASEHGIPDSPYARFAVANPAAYGHGPIETALAHLEAMVEAADARDDEFAAVLATAQSVTFLVRLRGRAEADRQAEEALQRAARSGNASLLAVSLVTAFSLWTFEADAPDMERAAQMMDTYGDAASRTLGGNTYAWLLTYRAYARAELHPRQATAWAVQAASAADRAGVPFAMVAALEVLAMASHRAGLHAEGSALSRYLEGLAPELHVAVTTRLAAERRAVIGAAREPDGLDSPSNRAELLALLRRIQHAVS